MTVRIVAAVAAQRLNPRRRRRRRGQRNRRKRWRSCGMRMPSPPVVADASLIILPARHELSAHHELINGIDVLPDYLPLTAQGLSTGHDPRHHQGTHPARRLTLTSFLLRLTRTDQDQISRCAGVIWGRRQRSYQWLGKGPIPGGHGRSRVSRRCTPNRAICMRTGTVTLASAGKYSAISLRRDVGPFVRRRHAP
jgi:hypothetical protein